MKCDICPRGCGINRDTTNGFCGVGYNKIKVASASRHMWEEPCISGTNGSGTVFFSGCNLKCVFCQNEKISRGKVGIDLSIAQLQELFLIIADSSVHNINLVTPTHYLPQIVDALRPIKHHINKPIVYNCSGYENEYMLENCSDVIDIYLTDMKYKSQKLSEKYSSCPDYFNIATRALSTMIKSKGLTTMKNGILQSGIIVRHLVLPSHKNDSIDILQALYDKFGNKNFLMSLMSQYTPMSNCITFPEINRKLTSLEYSRVIDTFEKLGFEGYTQEKVSASKSYIPDFDNPGEFLSAIIT